MLSPLQQKALRAPKTIELSSSAFQQGDPIPRAHTGYGRDDRPDLRWSPAPDGTRAIAIVMDDPDAPGGTWTHWTAWDLPAEATGIDGDADVRALGGAEGANGWGTAGWRGPKPPSGTHRYFFRVFALSRPLGLSPGARVEDVWSALAERTLAWGELMGTHTKL